MNKVFAELSESGDAIHVHFQYDTDTKNAVKRVPGARFIGPDKGGPYWKLPLSLDSGQGLRKQLGRNLVLGPELNSWGKEEIRKQRNLATIASSDDAELRRIPEIMPEFHEWLRPYQRADIAFMATADCVNGNQPGLGKTAEVIGAVYEAGIERGPHLVVAPRTSLDVVWRAEIERWTDGVVFTLSGDTSQGERNAMPKDLMFALSDDLPVWVITTADMLRRGLPFDVAPWQTFTVDEYHKTGLPEASGDPTKGSKFSQVAKAIKSNRRWALSGTPMGGKPIKLWGALHFLDSKSYSSKWRWAERWMVIHDNKFGKEILGIKPGVEDDFYAALAPHFLRRLKSEVLPQLPPKQYVEVWCGMTKKQAKQYEKFAADAEIRIEEEQLTATSILAEYQRLKMFATAYCNVKVVPRGRRCGLCKGEGVRPETEDTCELCEGTGKLDGLKLVPTTDSGKLPYLRERLAEVGIDPDDLEGDAVAVVASQHKETVDMVHRYLEGIGIPTAKITGDVTKKGERTKLVQQFQAGEIRVMCMTTTAGGVSITLDRADTVHILDETWVPDDQEQLEDRIHRASRMHQVTCYYYRSLGTVEEYIRKVAGDKEITNREILDLRRQGFRATQAENA